MKRKQRKTKLDQGQKEEKTIKRPKKSKDIKVFSKCDASPTKGVENLRKSYESRNETWKVYMLMHTC